MSSASPFEKKMLADTIIRRMWYFHTLSDCVQNNLRELMSLAGFHKGGTR